MAGPWPDDDTLLDALRDALAARAAVPEDFVTIARGSFAWHEIDAELATLTYDSTLDEARLAAVTRAESASLRALTFESPRLTIELEITEDALLGQVIPAIPAQVELQGVSGTRDIVDLDEVGCFVVRPVPAVTFRLLVRLASSDNVITGWIAV